MSTYISMLRGINVGAQKTIRMVELISAYESLDLSSIKTYVQSGNVVFESAEQDSGRLGANIEAQIERAFGYKVSVFLRTPAEFKNLIAGNPFLAERKEDPARLHVTFLYRPVAESEIGRLERPKTDADEFVAGTKEIYLFCPNGYGRTKLSNGYFEKVLGLPATTRNWNTVLALYKLAEEH